MMITFKEFVKQPILAILFILLLAVGYLYIDQKMFYNAQIEAQGQKIEKLELRVEQLTEQLRKSDSTYSAVASRLATLQELGKIK